MTTWTTRIACLSLLALAPAASADKATTKKEAISVNANEMKWTDAPPDLPKGMQMAVLHGNPMKAGTFTVRFKMPDGYKVPPHWHSKDEQLTILSGTLVMHMGDAMDAPSHDLEAGAYHFLPGKARHAAEAKGETIVQVESTGPFVIHYVNAADNPNPKTARK